MEVTRESKNRIVSIGRITGMKTAPEGDGFVARIKAVVPAFGALRKAYSIALSNDGKVLGLERLELIACCERLAEAVCSALYYVALSQRGAKPECLVEISLSGHENRFRVYPASTEWSLHTTLRLSKAKSIEQSIQSLAEQELATFLGQLHGFAEDGIISVDEQIQLIPALLALADAILDLRCLVEACSSST